MSVWPNHYSLDIYEAPCYRMNRSQGSQLGTSACIQRLTNQNFATSNSENLATWLFFLKLVEVNLTLQSRHNIFIWVHPEELQNYPCIYDATRRSQWICGNDFVWSVCCGGNARKPQKETLGDGTEGIMACPFGHPHLNPIETVTVLSVMVKATP